jgi:hypothetical protein
VIACWRGLEQAGQTSFTPFGYGNPLYNNSGCLHEGSTVCAQNTSRVWQVAGDAWYSLYKGSYGTLQIGAQDSYTRRYIFNGIGGSPSTDEGTRAGPSISGDLGRAVSSVAGGTR